MRKTASWFGSRRSTEYKVVKRRTLTTWQAPPQIVSSTLLGAAAERRREASKRAAAEIRPRAAEPISGLAGSAMDACEDASQQKERIAY
jgi:hypothetical protein